MEPVEFYKSAIGLDLDIEVNRRNSTSRTYYCLFHSVKGLFQHVPSYIGMHTHENLYEFLMSGQCSEGYCPKKLKSIAYVLKATKRLRTEADYILDSSYCVRRANTAIATVDCCLSRLAEMAGSDAA